MAPNDLYSEHAELIESALSHACRKHRLTDDAGDEFASWARLKLFENDCAILAKFQGRSSIRTYLITVIQRLFLDWRIKEWGKWRPSTEARRQGPVAIELERLILRDRIDFEQAVELLVSRGTATSREECADVWALLPQRPGRRPADEEALEAIAAPALGDPVVAGEQRGQAARASAVLADSLPRLEAQEQLIIKLRYQDGFTVARIAQLIGEEQKRLYRRFEHIHQRLRQAMAAAGVSAEEVRDLLGNPVVEFASAFGAEEAGNREIGPSIRVNAEGGA